MMTIKKISVVILLLSAPMAHAWTWTDLWYTADQQGAQLMQNKDYKTAQKTFRDPMWRATAAYRAQNYPAAIAAFAKDATAAGFYNQGNALAQLKRYAEALHAYDESLKRLPNDPDAVHNRAIVEKLLKKDQKDKNQSGQNKQKQDKQDKQDKQEQDKQDKQEQDKQEQDKQEQDKQQQDKQQQDKQEQDKQEPKASSSADDQLAHDQKEAHQQWLNLVPDDPGGLLRQKFRRDHWRRIQENQ